MQGPAPGSHPCLSGHTPDKGRSINATGSGRHPPAGPEPVTRSKDPPKSPDIPGQPEEPLATPCPRRTAAPPSKHSPAPKTKISTRRRAMHNNSPEAMPELHAAAQDVAARDKLEGGRAFVMHTEFSPAGDQPTAIVELSEGVRGGERSQVLLGATGTGKTFTMARVIEETQRPAIILAPNKTLAAQLYGEFKGFFPENAVEYFVSYYDYYQPEAYVPRSDTYIEKESQINEQIDRMRHSATRALLERDDVIIVASVSCIYGIGSVETYGAMTQDLKTGESYDQRKIMADLVAQQYKRNDQAFQRGSFRVRGDSLEIF